MLDLRPAAGCLPRLHPRRWGLPAGPLIFWACLIGRIFCFDRGRHHGRCHGSVFRGSRRRPLLKTQATRRGHACGALPASISIRSAGHRISASFVTFKQAARLRRFSRQDFDPRIDAAQLRTGDGAEEKRKGSRPQARCFRGLFRRCGICFRDEFRTASAFRDARAGHGRRRSGTAVPGRASRDPDTGSS